MKCLLSFTAQVIRRSAVSLLNSCLKSFSAHREVDKGEDIKLYQYRETQENSIKKQHVDAQFLVKFPFIYMDPKHLQANKQSVS